MKVAVLGVCNSRNVLEAANRSDLEIEPYIFQPSFLDITKPGLGIPYKDFYKIPSIKGKEETANFTKKTMQLDLNKRALSTIESLNPDLFVIDVSSLTMRTYEVTYKDKKVFSVNAYSPTCYEFLQQSVDFDFKRIEVTEDMSLKALDELSIYLKANWDLSKVVIFKYKVPKYYLGLDEKIHEYPKEDWGNRQAILIEKYVDYFSKLLPSCRVFEDADLNIGFPTRGEKERKESVPSPFHTSEDTQRLQGLLFRKFLFNEDSKEIDNIKSKLAEEIKAKLCS